MALLGCVGMVLSGWAIGAILLVDWVLIVGDIRGDKSDREWVLVNGDLFSGVGLLASNYLGFLSMEYDSKILLQIPLAPKNHTRIRDDTLHRAEANGRPHLQLLHFQHYWNCIVRAAVHSTVLRVEMGEQSRRRLPKTKRSLYLPDLFKKLGRQHGRCLDVERVRNATQNEKSTKITPVNP